MATTFGQPGDKWVGGKAIALGRRVNGQDVGIAHRTLPMGHTALLCLPRTLRCLRAPVIDRGPYGALLGQRWVIKRRARDPGKWRACVDLTPAASKALGHNGLEPAIVIYVGDSSGRGIHKTTPVPVGVGRLAYARRPYQGISHHPGLCEMARRESLGW
jgi:hypothetical protein